MLFTLWEFSGVSSMFNSAFKHFGLEYFIGNVVYFSEYQVWWTIISICPLWVLLIGITWLKFCAISSLRVYSFSLCNYSCLPLFKIVMFYRLSVNTELGSTERRFQRKYRVNFLRAASHNIFINQSVYNLVLCGFPFV